MWCYRSLPALRMGTSLTLLVAAVCGPVQNSVSTGQPVRILVDSTQVALPQPAVYDQGQIVAPLRALLEAMGCEVQWDGATQTIGVRRGATVLVLRPGQATAQLGARTIALPLAPQVMGGTTVGPVQPLVEALGATMVWDEGSQVATISLAPGGVPPGLPPEPQPAGPPPEPTPEPTPEPQPAGTLSEERAVAIATQYLKDRDQYPQQDITQVTAELGQAPANNYWEALVSGGPIASGAAERPCWIVTFTYEGLNPGSWKKVYVDQATGQVIGGQQTR